MKKLLLLSIFSSLLIFANHCWAQQVGISGNGAVPDPSSILDINVTGMSPKGGLLIPRMTTTERNAISGPSESLLIYNTDTHCFDSYYNGWVSFGCIGCQLPGTFTDNSATSIATTSFSANWTASTGATAYYLDVSTSNTFASFVTGYNNLNVSNVVTYSVNTNLACNTAYYYRVRAYNACGTSTNSNTITLTTTTCYPTVTGGTLTSDATYYYRTFTSDGNLVVSGGSVNCDYLIVAGGGNGGTIDLGTNNASGGGGAGGLLTGTTSVSSGTYPITVGAGGAQSNTLMNNGGNSVFNGITAIGGGAGANYHVNNVGADGGSGGGGRVNAIGGNGTSGQGNNGGTGLNQGGGGGGGGAGAVGGTATTVNGAVGGAGVVSSISGASVTYAGGGGGGSASTGTGGAGGAGGGGAGATFDTNATSGSANTGGGGGGAGGTNGTVKTGGSGGSGIVIVRYTRAQVGG